MPRRKPPMVLLRRLSAQLKTLRSRDGLTLNQAAEGLGWTTAKMNRIENANSTVSEPDLQHLADFYNLSGAERERLLAKAAMGGRSSRWWSTYAALLPKDHADYIEVEEQLVGIRNFDALLVNGLLQTEDYARTVVEASGMGLLSPAELDRLVEIRMTRQRLLHKDENPLQLWSITTELALRSVVGSPAVMKAQYEHLLEMTELPNVTLQVLPTTKGAHPGVEGSFSLLEFPDPPPFAYVETLVRAAYVEDPREVHRYTLTLDHLRAMAHDVTESRKILAALVKESSKS